MVKELDVERHFSFPLYAQNCTFGMPTPSGDNIDQEFIHALNEVLRSHGIQAQLYFVNAMGMQFATQNFHLAFLDKASYEELAATPGGFTWEEEDW